MLELERAGVLHRRGGELRFLDVCERWARMVWRCSVIPSAARDLAEWSSPDAASNAAQARSRAALVPAVLMRLTRIELHELALPLSEPFIISGGTMTVRRSLVVVLHDDDGHVGYGESPAVRAAVLLRGDARLRAAAARAGPDPAPARPRGRAAPRRSTRCCSTASAATRSPARRSRPRPGTSRRTAAAPASPPCSPSGWASRRRPRIPCGVALGIPPDRSTDTLRRWIDDALAHGYRRVKIKVGPGLGRGAGARRRARRSRAPASRSPSTPTAATSGPSTRPNLRALDEAGLLYIEQPLAPDELLGHVRLSQTLRTPVCVDETLHGAARRRASCSSSTAPGSGT